MITLADLLFVVNDSAVVQILDNDGETLVEGEASDLQYTGDAEPYKDAIVMDVYSYNNMLVICIEV